MDLKTTLSSENIAKSEFKPGGESFHFSVEPASLSEYNLFLTEDEVLPPVID